MNSNLMLKMEGEDAVDLWDPSAAFLWPSSGEESNESLPPPMWANVPPPQIASNWNIIDDDTVLFGDYSDLGVDDLYAEGVIVDSCLNSSNSSSRLAGDEEEEGNNYHFGADHEEQVHFFDTPNPAAVWGEDDCFKSSQEVNSHLRPQHHHVAVSIAEERDEEKISIEVVAPISSLSVKIGADRGLNDSVVSTPDVLNDVIKLEDEGLLWSYNECTGDNPIKIEGTSDCVLAVVDDHDDYYEEFVVEFVDDDTSALSGCGVGEYSTTAPSSVSTAAVDDSRENTEFEDDDKDEEYQPPSPVERKMRMRARSNKRGPGDGYVTKRGRPAKPIRTHLTPRELANLDPHAKKDKVLRFKNNEASRLSRFKRRQKDLKLGDQCDLFEAENRDLRRMLKAHKRLHSRLRALIIGQKTCVY